MASFRVWAYVSLLDDPSSRHPYRRGRGRLIVDDTALRFTPSRLTRLVASIPDLVHTGRGFNAYATPLGGIGLALVNPAPRKFDVHVRRRKALLEALDLGGYAVSRVAATRHPWRRT